MVQLLESNMDECLPERLELKVHEVTVRECYLRRRRRANKKWQDPASNHSAVLAF
jgi:hypothetical protein